MSEPATVDIAVHCAFTELVSPSSLIPHPRNPNRHPEAQITLLAKIIAHQGWRSPITVSNRSGFVITGHARLAAALRLGCDRVPVDRQDFVDEAHEWAHLVADNRLSEIAEMELPALKDILIELDTGAFDMDLTGYDAKALEDIIAPMIPDMEDPVEASESKLQELAAKWRVERGQLWAIGGHRLLCGDSTDPADVARLMGDERASLCSTDPPYLVDYDAQNHPQSQERHSAGVTSTNKRWDEYRGPECSVEFFAKWLSVAIEHALSDRVAFYQWHASKRQSLVEQAWIQNDMLVHQQIIWFKTRPVLTRSHFMWQHEPCFYGWRNGKQPEMRPEVSGENTTVWQVAGEQEGLHPTQKPLELFLRPMRYHTAPGAIVYEPFSGSGTQHVAAAKFNRRCYGMEQEPKFCAAVLERLSGLGLVPELVSTAEPTSRPAAT